MGEIKYKRCFDIENACALLSHPLWEPRYSSCGNWVRDENGIVYCRHNGKIEGYAVKCAAIEKSKKAKELFIDAKMPEQLGLFGGTK